MTRKKKLKNKFIKLNYRSSIDRDQLKFLRREIKILEKINHPNIVDIIEVYEYEEAQLIVFEIMNGGEVIIFNINFNFFFKNF